MCLRCPCAVRLASRQHWLCVTMTLAIDICNCFCSMLGCVWCECLNRQSHMPPPGWPTARSDPTVVASSYVTRTAAQARLCKLISVLVINLCGLLSGWLSCHCVCRHSRRREQANLAQREPPRHRSASQPAKQRSLRIDKLLLDDERRCVGPRSHPHAH